MRSLLQCCYLIIFLVQFNQVVVSKIIEGELSTTENWVFLTRFCFLSVSGRFVYEFEYPVEYETQSLLLYYDSKRQWPAAYKTPKTCQEKFEILLDGIGQIINLTDSFRDSGCRRVQINGSEKFHCNHSRQFSSRQPRWWFMALSNCKSSKGIKIQYKIKMTNDVANHWFTHFSADEFYILHTDVIFGLLYYGLFLASCVVAVMLNMRRLLHTTYKIYLLSLLSQCLALTFLSVYYILYAKNGFGEEPIKLTGRILKALSTLLFLLLLLLLAKGFTVTRARLKRSGYIKLSGFMFAYTVIYAALFIYELKFFDPGEVLYLYESPAGYGLIALRLAGWLWFVYSLVFTLICYPTKSAFFTRLFLLYSVWFVSGPVVILIATFVVPKYMREKIMNAVEILIAIEAHLVFFVLTRPSIANKNFPFHVRTTQIDVMAKTGEAGGATLDHFSHYQYAPSKGVHSSVEQPHTVFTITPLANGSSQSAHGRQVSSLLLPANTLSGFDVSVANESTGHYQQQQPLNSRQYTLPAIESSTAN